MDKKQRKTGNLTITLATLLVLIHEEGIQINDSKILSICEEISESIRRLSVQPCSEDIRAALKRYHLSASDDDIEGFLNGVYGHNIYEPIDVFDIGQKLVSAIEETLSSDADLEQVLNWLQQKGISAQRGWNEESREKVIFAIRKHNFQHSMPWLAQIAQRQDNQIVMHWVLVEQFTDMVRCMDPNPWDDIEEEYEMPLVDFMIKWELAGRKAIHF
jgi:hypothetical protein